MYYPGRVATSSLYLARINNTRAWGAGGGGVSIDHDITATYYDSILSLLLHAMSGIHTAAVLWGDSQWFTQMANSEVHQLLSKLVHATKTSAEHRLRKLVFASFIYDTSRGEMHDVARRELISTDTAMLSQCLPAADTRSLLIVKLLMTIDEHQCSMSVVVPPPYDNCAWDAHAYLRSQDEAVLATNALWATVLHVGGPDRPQEELAQTLQRLQQRLCAPIPNTQAAEHLLAALRAHRESPPAAPGGAAWTRERTEELLEELRAMEGELVSVRAAYVAATQRCEALEMELHGRVGPDAAKRIPLDPAAVQREQLRVSEDLLRKLNVDFQDLNRRLALIEKAAGVGADLRLRALLLWRQQECALLLQRLTESHLRIVSGQVARVLPSNLVVDARAAASGGPPPLASGGGGVTASMQRVILEAQHEHERQAGDGHGGRNVAMNAVSSVAAGGHGALMTVGGGIAVDPLLVLYQGRMIELENEVAKMTDVDVKACVDEFYVRELARMEVELVDWITRFRVAESKREVAEQALRMR